MTTTGAIVIVTGHLQAVTRGPFVLYSQVAEYGILLFK